MGEKENPFHETMPGVEVWHRRMPPFLPFGETPYMERVMSGQINRDLKGEWGSPHDVLEARRLMLLRRYGIVVLLPPSEG